MRALAIGTTLLLVVGSQPSADDSQRPSALAVTDVYAGTQPERHLDNAESQCVAGEQDLYSCRFGPNRVVSVCVGDRMIFYRDGPPGDPTVHITGEKGGTGVWQGSVAGGIGGSQRHVRFAQDGVNYIVLSGVYGEASDNPGRAYSGVTILRGKEEIASVDCQASATGDLRFARLPDYVLWETADGPYDAWF